MINGSIHFLKISYNFVRSDTDPILDLAKKKCLIGSNKLLFLPTKEMIEQRGK